MNKILRIACLALAPLAAFAQGAKLDHFAAATFTEIVNDVSVVKSESGDTGAATPNSVLHAPDLVKTGRKSRAQLTLADGTLVRVTSNAVFTLAKDSRTLRVEQGAALFHAPKNAGGGRIVTNSATCSVTGTTVLVEKTPFGVRYTVLEGKAEISRPDGAKITLDGGYSCFIPTGSTGPLTKTLAIFTAMTLTELTQGFTASLPSQADIDATRRSFLTTKDYLDQTNGVNVQLISPNGE